MIKSAPIFVCGIPRSGSSMIAATINLCGAFGGIMSKRGMYSNDTIREVLLKPYLESIGGDKEGQYPLPKTDSVIIPAYWKNRVEQVMIDEGYKNGLWMYKDSKLALTWPLWNISFPDAKWIIVRRRTGDIVQSCMKTGYMRAFKDVANIKAIGAKDEASAWLWWVDEYEKKFIEMINEGINHRIIWPERMVDGDYQQLYDLCDWLGLKWDEEALKFIESLLWGKREQKERINHEVKFV
jgi:hypothetical protein